MTMRLLAQCLLAGGLALRSVPQRLGSALVVSLSMACVIAVLLSMLAQTEGLVRAFDTESDPRGAIVLSAQEFGGSIARSDARTILDAPGIARDAQGQLLADPEIVFWIPPTRGYTLDSPALTGLGRAGLALRPGFHLVAGRLFQPGRQELIVGAQAARAFGLKVGDHMILPNGLWPIVGIFAAQRSILEGELVGDAETLMSTSSISGYSSVLVRLASRAAFGPMRQWLTSNPALGVTAERQSDYALRSANRFTAYFTHVAYAVAVIMTLGALFAAVKIMYASVSARTRELATLRAIGYAPFPLALSVIIETVCLALAGAALGGLVAWRLFDGMIIADNRFVAEAQVTPELFVLGLAWAAGLAVAGALLPSIRAARLPVAEALRAL